MVEKIEKIEFASTKKEVCSTKQEVNIPLRINITRGCLKVKFSKERDRFRSRVARSKKPGFRIHCIGWHRLFRIQ